jgi:hypothetical protein
MKTLLFFFLSVQQRQFKHKLYLFRQKKVSPINCRKIQSQLLNTRLINLISMEDIKQLSLQPTPIL